MTYQNRDGQESKTDDLIFTTDNEIISNLEHIGHLGQSDHQILSFEIENTFRICKPKSHTKLKYNQTNLEGFKNQMNCNWQEELKTKSANEAYNFFLEKYYEACDKNVPKQTVKNQNKLHQTHLDEVSYLKFNQKKEKRSYQVSKYKIEITQIRLRFSQKPSHFSYKTG